MRNSRALEALIQTIEGCTVEEAKVQLIKIENRAYRMRVGSIHQSLKPPAIEIGSIGNQQATGHLRS